jgi:hypothetical protein
MLLLLLLLLLLSLDVTMTGTWHGGSVLMLQHERRWRPNSGLTEYLGRNCCR